MNFLGRGCILTSRDDNEVLYAFIRQHILCGAVCGYMYAMLA